MSKNKVQKGAESNAFGLFQQYDVPSGPVVQPRCIMAEESKQTPAYVSYKTFKSSLFGLPHVPTTIDYSVYQSMNGSTRNALFSAFKFFGLIGPKGEPSKVFREMAGKDEAVWKKNLADLLNAYYKDQLAPLKGGSIASLKKSFEDVAGPSLVAPACRFLISAAEDAGIEVSPSVAKASVGNAVPKRKRAKDNRNDDDGGIDRDEMENDPGAGTISFPIPIAGKSPGKIVVPKDLSDADLPMLNAMVAAVVAYAKQSRKAGGSES